MDAIPEARQARTCARGICSFDPCICVPPRAVLTSQPRVKVDLYIFRHGQTAFNAGGVLQGHIDVGLSPAGRQQARAAGRILASRNIIPSIFVSSDLSRASGTAHYLAAAWRRAMRIEESPPMVLLKDLRERALGHLEGHLASEVRASIRSGDAMYDEPPPQYMHYLDRIAAENPHFAIESGPALQARLLRGLMIAIRRGVLAHKEATAQFGQRPSRPLTEIERRARGALARLLHHQREAIPIVVVTHGQALRAALGGLFLPQPGMLDSLRGRPRHFPTEAANCALTVVSLEVPTKFLDPDAPYVPLAAMGDVDKVAGVVPRAGIDRPPGLNAASFPATGSRSDGGSVDQVDVSTSMLPPSAQATLEDSYPSSRGRSEDPLKPPVVTASASLDCTPVVVDAPRPVKLRPSKLAKSAAFGPASSTVQPTDDEIEHGMALWRQWLRLWEQMRPMLIALNQFGAGFTSRRSLSTGLGSDSADDGADSPLSGSATDEENDAQDAVKVLDPDCGGC